MEKNNFHYMIRCVPISQYCQLTGMKKNTILRRLERGYLKYGVHILPPPPGAKERYVDIPAMDRWVVTNGRA